MSRFTRPATLAVISAALLGGAGGCQIPTAKVADYQTVPHGPRRDTETARRHNSLAVELIEQQEYAEARKHLKQALQAGITFGPAHNNLGNVYYHEDQLYLAAWEFQYAISLMPHHPEPRNNLGLVMEATGKFDDAIDHYEKAMALSPDDPQVIGNLARARVSRGDRGEATKELLEQLVLKDSREDWRNWAAEQLSRLPRHEVDRP